MAEASTVKRMVLVGPAHPLRGGIADFNEALARAFARKGYQVTVVSFSMQYPRFLFPGKTQVTTDPKPADLKIESMINSIHPLTWFKAARLIRSLEPELVVIRYWLPFMGPCLGSIARLVKRKGKTRVIALADNVIPHEKRPGDRLFTSWFLKGCQGFLTLSRQVSEELKTFIPQAKVVYHPHPIYDVFGPAADKEEARKHLGLPEGKYLLFFGFIRAYKGLDLLLEALGDPRLKKQNVKLIVAGEFYEPKEPYTEIIHRYGLEDRLILHDRFIAREDVRHYFCAADLVVQPYKSASQSGITQIAYHFERPMLVTRVGGLEEVVPHGKVGYVAEKTPESIAGYIFDFYENHREIAFHEAAAKEKARFSWESLVQCIEQLCRTL